MDTYSRPSSAAIIVARPITEACDAITDALRPLGYRPFSGDPPSWQPRADDEWLGMTAVEIEALTVFFPEHQGWTFRIAHAYAAAATDSGVVAYRRQLGMASCFKFYALGQPQFKHGEDPDLEVGWNIPPGLAVDVPSPEELGLPANAEAFEASVGPALRPYAEHRRDLSSQDRCLSFLHRTSPLWM